MKMTSEGSGGSGDGRIAITEFASVSAGRWHTCGVGIDGSVACWGDDEDGKPPLPRGIYLRQRDTCAVKTGTARPSPPDGEFASVSAGT